MSLKSMERERAVFAYDKVVEYRKNNSQDADNDKLKSYAKSILSRIQLNGLVATFAFVEIKQKSKDDKQGDGKKEEKANVDQKAYTALNNITKEWIEIKHCIKLNGENECISNYFARLSAEEYRAVQQEVIKLFCWIRRYAESCN